MADTAAVVDSSAVCNVSQLVHTEDTEVVPTYDWASFLLPHFRKLQNIKKYHHFASPLRLQETCSPESMQTPQKPNCLSSGMTGTLLQTILLLSLHRRACQTNDSGTYTSKSALSARRNIERRPLHIRPCPTPREGEHLHQKNSLYMRLARNYVAVLIIIETD